mmetsp:Transcript_6838/g.8136  ORF Transcript_6838/g.8136 Transcript_6838/m.8136 type:complete len:250 (-) Transcript_6838:205-954(-)
MLPALTRPTSAWPLRTADGRVRSNSRNSSPRVRGSPSTPTSPASSTTRRTGSSRHSGRLTSHSRTSTPRRFRSRTFHTISTLTPQRLCHLSALTVRSRPPSSPTLPPRTPRCAPSLRRSALTPAPSSSTRSSMRACLSRATRGRARSPSGCAILWAGLRPQAPSTTSCTRMPTRSSLPTRRCRSVSSKLTLTLSATWSPPSLRPTAAAIGRPLRKISTAYASSMLRLTTRSRAFKPARAGFERGPVPAP